VGGGGAAPATTVFRRKDVVGRGHREVPTPGRAAVQGGGAAPAMIDLQEEGRCKQCHPEVSVPGRAAVCGVRGSSDNDRFCQAARAPVLAVSEYHKQGFVETPI